jgi:hypothetical protein
MNDPKRMAALQAKGAGAPPAEPPDAPPGVGGPGGDEMSGMPPPEVVIPKIADLLKQMADKLSDDQKSAVLSAAEQLQAAFPANPSDASGMQEGDNEAYGESTPVQ